MQKVYLIDAYNLLFRLAKSRAALKTQRHEFIERLNEFIASLGLNVTLIFDGADPFSKHHAREHFDALEIIYTPKGLSADTFILEKLDASRRPENYVVVTNDRDLATSCKVRKAKHLTIEQFISLLQKKKKKPKTTSPPNTLKDSDRKISRLLQIFEKRLNEDTSIS